jgi:hypothetical protein
MIRDAWEIINMMAEIWPQCTRPDRDGVDRGVARTEDGRVIIPAGSLILTGTPEGTAIESPTGWDRARLLVRGNASLRRAKFRFVTHAVLNARRMGFLHAGDVVESRIEHLGSQRWRVVE